MAMIEVGALPRGRALVSVAHILYVVAGEGTTRIHFRDGSFLDVRQKLGEVHDLIQQSAAA